MKAELGFKKKVNELLRRGAGILKKTVFIQALRPLKNVQFCSRPRKANILTTGIH